MDSSFFTNEESKFCNLFGNGKLTRGSCAFNTNNVKIKQDQWGGPVVNHPVIQDGFLPVSQVANLPGYYKIPNKTQDPLLIAHNFSNVLSTMRT
jgi:hypothetical protein